MWVKITDSNLKENMWYKTSLFHNDKYQVIQVMKFYRGLWWTSDDVYTHYAPSRVWKD